MPRPLKSRPAPLSIRLSTSERQTLERLAQGRPLSGFIKSRVFGASGAMTADRALLGQILGQLGALRIAGSMTALADAADSGSLIVDDLTAKRLHEACDDIRSIHSLLMTALGKNSAAQSWPLRPREQFVLAALAGEPFE